MNEKFSQIKKSKKLKNLILILFFLTIFIITSIFYFIEKNNFLISTINFINILLFLFSLIFLLTNGIIFVYETIKSYFIESQKKHKKRISRKNNENNPSHKYLTKQAYKKFEVIILIIAFLEYFIYIIKNFKLLCGREGIYSIVFGDAIQNILNISFFPRTYSFIIYKLIDHFIPINIFFVQNINRFIIGILFIIFAYSLFKKINKNFWFVFLFLLINQRILLHDLNSIEYLVLVLLGTIILLNKLTEIVLKKEMKISIYDFLILLSSYILISGGRLEFALIFGVPLLLIYTLILINTKKITSKDLFMFLVFSITIMLFSFPIIYHYRVEQDPLFKGKFGNSIIGGFFNRLKLHIIDENHLQPMKFLNFFGFLTIILFPLSLFIKKQEKNRLYYVLILVGLMFYSYLLSLLGFHMAGLIDPPKYNVHLYVLSIIFIFLWFSIYFQKTNFKLKILIVSLLIILEVLASPRFLYFPNKGWCNEKYYKIYNLYKSLKDEFNKCKIVIFNSGFSNLQYIVRDLNQKTIFFQSEYIKNPSLNENIAKKEWINEVLNKTYINASCLLMMIRKYDKYHIIYERTQNLSIKWIKKIIKESPCEIKKDFKINNDSHLIEIECK